MSGAAEYAIAGTIVSSAISLGAVVVSRIRCRTVRSEDGTPHCLSACSDKPLIADDIQVDEYTVGDRQVLLFSS